MCATVSGAGKGSLTAAPRRRWMGPELRQSQQIVVTTHDDSDDPLDPAEITNACGEILANLSDHITGTVPPHWQAAVGASQSAPRPLHAKHVDAGPFRLRAAFVALLGPPCAGRSTTARLLAGAGGQREARPSRCMPPLAGCQPYRTPATPPGRRCKGRCTCCRCRSECFGGRAADLGCSSVRPKSRRRCCLG
jgi:hypothetical protein